jgi:mono/diheme cytochrome c family protein
MPSPFLALMLLMSQSDGGVGMVAVLLAAEDPPAEPQVVVPEPSPPPLVFAPQSPTGAEPSTQRPFREDFDASYIWLVRCSGCHGLAGQGNPRVGRDLGARDVTSNIWHIARTDEQIREAITDGLTGTKMKAFGHLGTDRQFDDLVAYIRQMRR